MTIVLVAYKAMKWLKKLKVNTGIERIASTIVTVLGAGVLASGARASRHRLTVPGDAPVIPAPWRRRGTPPWSSATAAVVPMIWATA